MDIYNTIVTVSVSICAGVLASLIKPVIDYDIYKRKKRIDSLAIAIAHARNFVTMDYFNILSFGKTEVCSQLSKYFSKEINDIINMDAIDYLVLSDEKSDYVDEEHRELIMKELNRIAVKYRIE